MRIQLSVPWTDDNRVEHHAGSKVNVTPEVARTLVQDGRAAVLGVGYDAVPAPPPKNGKGSGVEAWHRYTQDPVVALRLEDAGQTIAADATREDVLIALETAGISTDQPADTDSPTTGDNQKGVGDAHVDA